jgi:hypothetical protein
MTKIKINLQIIFFMKNHYLPIQATLEAFRPQKRTSSTFFLVLWVIFALLDPDIDLIESGFNPDPEH